MMTQSEMDMEGRRAVTETEGALSASANLISYLCTMHISMVLLIHRDIP